MFHYNGPDCNVDPTVCPTKMHYYPDYVSDNNREFFDATDIENRTDACEVQGPDELGQNTFVGLSNFVVPANLKEFGRINAIRDAKRLNQYYAMKDYVETCSDILATDINFILNDWWGIGELLRFTQDYNSARALGDTFIPPTPAPSPGAETESPTYSPTFYPTFTPETDAPTVSFEPSFSPSLSPTGRPNPCPALDGDCKGCKNNNEECLWCVSSESCYNRFVFEDIFDMDDEVIPCAGEDILNSFDTTCTAPSKSQKSVYDDDFVTIDDFIENNETIADIDDEIEEEIEEIDSQPPTLQPADPPTLPPIFVPLSPPTAVAVVDSVIGNESGASSSNVFTCGITTIFVMTLLLVNL